MWKQTGAHLLTFRMKESPPRFPSNHVVNDYISLHDEITKKDGRKYMKNKNLETPNHVHDIYNTVSILSNCG